MTNLAEKIGSEHIQDLTNALFLINGLHAKLAQESQLIATSVGQVNLAAKQFDGYLEDLKDQGEKIEITLRNESHIMGNKIAQEISRDISGLVSEELNKALSKLQETTRSIERDLSNSRGNIRFFSRYTVVSILLATLVGGLLGGGFVHYLYPPISSETGLLLKAGEMLEKAWPKLSQAERSRIQTLGK